mgnify:CR=1 FL=1
MPASLGTFPVTTPLFTALLVSVIVIVGALTYFPVLALGPVPSEDVKVHAKAAGYSWATIRRAQAAIGIKPKRTGGAGERGTWAWALPDGQEPDQMPLPNGEGA